MSKTLRKINHQKKITQAPNTDIQQMKDYYAQLDDFKNNNKVTQEEIDKSRQNQYMEYVKQREDFENNNKLTQADLDKIRKRQYLQKRKRPRKN
jgi:hypothetical protein